MQAQLQVQQQVKEFLNEFKTKMSIYNVVFRDDRKKNTLSILQLDMLPVERKEILKKLEITDYCEGPTKDNLNDLPPMWVFGKQYKGKEIYIKISIGFENLPVICISFHKAEFAITYPFKN
jgi:hypothetical protein